MLLMLRLAMGHEKLDAGILIAIAYCLLYGEQSGLDTSLDDLLVWLHVFVTERHSSAAQPAE
jgi:hypothetical protein